MYITWPLPSANQRITSTHGPTGNDGTPHVGIDISCVTGTPVYAAHDGQVRYQWTELGGICVLLENQEFYTRYCHLSSYAVSNNARVTQGDLIARSGNTGAWTTGAHLHFEAHTKDGTAVDPLKYLYGGAMNRIGLHILGGTGLRLANGNARPTVVKLVDVSPTYVKQVRDEVGADCLIIIRWYESSQPLGAPYENAQSWFAKHKADILAMKGSNVVFEGYNEAGKGIEEAYSFFELYRGQLLHNVGASVCYNNSSVGEPAEGVWPLHKKWLDDMQPGDYVGVHEYWSDTADIDNKWHCARWQLIPLLAYKPKVVTECGRDVTPDTGKGKPGYKQTTNDDGFMVDLIKYNELIKRWPEVRGATVFQVGSIDPQFAAFDVTSLWPRVVEKYTTEAIVIPAPPPVTPPPTSSKEEIERALGAEMQKYVIPLNPTAALERAAAAYGLLPASREFDLTIGGKTYRCQAYRSPGQREWQYGYYCEVPVWHDVKVFKRAN